MNLEFGTEKKFFDFIKDLDDKDVIALISHTDTDGITAAYVANKVIEADFVKFVGYEELNLKLAAELKEKGCTKIVFTDLYLGDKAFLDALEAFASVLILDHHPSADWNSAKTTFIKGENGYCAGYLCYDLFSRVQNIEQLDWLVACASIADYCYFKNSEWMEKIFVKYGETFSIENIKKGKFWDLQLTLSLALIYFRSDIARVYSSIKDPFGSIGDLALYGGEIQKEIDSLVERFATDRKVFPGGYYYEIAPRFPITSILSSILSDTDSGSIFLLLRIDGTICKLSARRQDKKQDMAAFLQGLIEGFKNSTAGGHVPASGGSFPVRHLPEFKKRLGIQ